MRDRNQLNLQQFNIQLSKSIFRNPSYKKILELEEYFSHKSSLWRSDTKTPNSWFDFVLPRSFREIRSLCISSWFFPENIQILLRLELEKGFSQFNFKQQLEINILISSKENCQKYLYLTQRYTGNEIFGNLLGNDLKDALRNLKLRFRRQTKPKKKVFRRGPKDKGSRRSDSSILILVSEIQKDCWIRENQKEVEKRRLLLFQTKRRILTILENWSEL